VTYHDYEGIAIELDERARLVADLGQRNLMILRNHGTLSVGETAADCWLGMFFLERACTQQIMALSAGRANLNLAPDAARSEVETQVSSPGMKLVTRIAWPGTLRELDRRSPGYDA
jgi:ribulose-5-phosphate 4-epimerase/fuculose-1-phosphate aldolase